MQPRHRILAIDDDPVNLAILEELFGADYDLATATSGEDGLEVAPRWEPELVVLDLTLPGIDGYETCRRLRALPVTRDAKIVLLSARAMVDDRLAGYQAGADDYVTKPCDPDELLAKVRILLRLHAVEAVDQLKSRFLDLLAHETRTPLTTIMGPAALIERNEGSDPQEVTELAGMILDRARHLQAVVDRSLLLCSFRVGEALLCLQDFDLASTVRSIAVETAHRVARGTEGLSLRVPDALSWRGDPSHLGMVVETLVHNALDHRRPGSPVVVDLSEDGNRVRLVVSNEGVGIDPARLPEIFAGFDVANVDDQGGHLGLNLPLSREIVLEHNGTIDVRSDRDGTTSFIVTLPRLPRSADTATNPSLASVAPPV